VFIPNFIYKELYLRIVNLIKIILEYKLACKYVHTGMLAGRRWRVTAVEETMLGSHRGGGPRGNGNNVAKGAALKASEAAERMPGRGFAERGPGTEGAAWAQCKKRIDGSDR
jgi:hypothetical protein